MRAVVRGGLPAVVSLVDDGASRYTMVPTAIAPAPDEMLITLSLKESLARSFASFVAPAGHGVVGQVRLPSEDSLSARPPKYAPTPRGAGGDHSLAGGVVCRLLGLLRIARDRQRAVTRLDELTERGLLLRDRVPSAARGRPPCTLPRPLRAEGLAVGASGRRGSEAMVSAT